MSDTTLQRKEVFPLRESHVVLSAIWCYFGFLKVPLNYNAIGFQR